MICAVPMSGDSGVESGRPSREVGCSRTDNTVCVAPNGGSCTWDVDSSGGMDVDMLCYAGEGAREGEGTRVRLRSHLSRAISRGLHYTSFIDRCNGTQRARLYLTKVRREGRYWEVQFDTILVSGAD